jgi:hypothetical protein
MRLIWASVHLYTMPEEDDISEKTKMILECLAEIAERTAISHQNPGPLEGLLLSDRDFKPC